MTAQHYCLKQFFVLACSTIDSTFPMRIPLPALDPIPLSITGHEFSVGTLVRLCGRQQQLSRVGGRVEIAAAEETTRGEGVRVG